MYAPSDYKNDDDFLKAAGITPASPSDKLNRIIEEAEEEGSEDLAEFDYEAEINEQTKKKDSVPNSLYSALDPSEINEVTFSEIALSKVRSKTTPDR